MDWIKKLCLAVVVLMILMDQQEGINAARILGLFPLAVKSHFMMSKTLLKALAERGHQVDVIGHFPLKNPPKNYHDIILPETTSLVNNLTFANAQHLSGYSIKRMINLAGDKICQLYNEPEIRNIVENPPNDPPYDLVITELFAADCYLAMGRHLKVPMVGMVVTQMFSWMAAPLGNPLNTAFVPSVFSDFSQHMNFYERLINTIVNEAVIAQFLYYQTFQLNLVNKLFGFNLTSLRELYKDFGIVLVNTHPTLGSVVPITPGVVQVGGIHVTEDDQDLSPKFKKWLDDSKDGFIYFSFGSMVKIESFPQKTIEAFYSAINRIAPIRVLMKIAMKNELPPGLPKNVITSSWLPQTKVLKHKNIRAFVTHGGLMSNIEAVTYGVPMVNIPIYGDQPVNARYNERNHIGITVDYRTITADSFTKALKTILTDKSYSEKTKQLGKLFTDRPISALDTGIFSVEYVLRNGNVLRSPADELYWWQNELLDVYGLLLMIMLFVFYIIKRLVSLIFALLFCQFGSQQQVRGSKIVSVSKKKK